MGGEGSQEERRTEENIPSSTTTPNHKLRETPSPVQSRRDRTTTRTTDRTSSTGMTRKRFLHWAGWGGGGLVATLVAREIFKPEPITTSFEFETVTVNAKGEEVSRSTHQAKFFKEDLGNGVILEMVSIPAGEFMMGSPRVEKERDEDEGPQRQVSVSAFFMGKFAVTQAQYQAVIGSNPANFQGDNRSVESVSWHDAVEFCKRLSQATGKEYRLPSEAEWEYACRAGTTTPFHFGETITTDFANYQGTENYANAPKGKYREKTTPVGSFPPNAFGLYDMHGNVWEWCKDDWHDNYQGAPSDDSAWLDKNDNRRVLRGGAWNDGPRGCRSANRGRNYPDRRVDYGLRVVCSSA